MTQELSQKTYFSPNLVGGKKMCVCQVCGVYTPNLWHEHLLEKHLKSLHFQFGEILG